MGSHSNMLCVLFVWGVVLLQLFLMCISKSFSPWPLAAISHAPRKSLKDGDLVCECTGMRFSSVPRLMEFLGVKGHAKFADRIVKVSNVQSDRGDEDIDKDIYVVLLGSAGYCQHYSGIRRHANAILMADCSAGPTSAFLKIVVRTPNGVGFLAWLVWS